MRRSVLLYLLIVAILGVSGSNVHAATADALPSPLDTSDASPVAAPAGSARSCGAPGFHPIVHEDVTAADIEAAGLSGAPIVPNQDTTIEAANGTPITLPAGTWSPAQGGAFVLVGGGESTTGISLVTGESWTFNASTQESGPQDSSFYYVMFGPWLVGTANDTDTDFWIINTDTGASLLTSELFGSPFTDARTPDSSAPRGGSDTVPVIISFFGTDGVDLVPTALALPSADVGDAWALDPPDAEAAGNGTITADGNRIVFVDPAGDRIRVLDGFTGEGITNYRAPEADAMVRAIGVASDDTTILLSDEQRVWTLDIETGEIATMLDPEGTVPSIAFDATTGTAVASTDGDAGERHFWLDPASDEVNELEIDNIEGPQQGWALLQMRAGADVDYALLNMATGEIATEPIHVNGAVPPTSPFQTGTEHGIWIVQGEPGQLLVFDGPGGHAFDLPLPEGDGSDWGVPAHGVSPNGECIIYTRLGSLFNDPPGVSWIARIEPDAEWTELPFEISDWLEVPEG